MATVTLHNLRKSYGSFEVIKGIDLAIADREFVVFVGPSGCGKSTLLRMIAGLEEITAGELLIDGKRVNEVGPADRGLAMVFQSYALYPHMTVRQNMAFALRLAHGPGPNASGKSVRRRESCTWIPISTAVRGTFPAASGSVSRSGARSCASPRSSCSTSRFPTWTPPCAGRCASRLLRLHDELKRR